MNRTKRWWPWWDTTLMLLMMCLAEIVASAVVGDRSWQVGAMLGVGLAWNLSNAQMVRKLLQIGELRLDLALKRAETVIGTGGGGGTMGPASSAGGRPL